ncbi:MAG: LacI family DNA-binding transcriptional regulator [Planctomycetota bacterium]
MPTPTADKYPMRITMKDIAEDCGVSRATVNQILGGHGHRFSDKTCKLVNDTAKRLGFRVNASARAIRTGKFNCVSLVLSEADQLGVIPRGLLTGIDQRMAERGKHLMVCHAPSQPDPAGETTTGLSTLMSQAMVDGHLIDAAFRQPAPFTELGEDGMPVIWLRCEREADCVYTDEHQAGYLATEHLLRFGHTRISVVHGRSDAVFLHQRLAGYRQAMTDAGLTPHVWKFPDPLHADYPKQQEGQIDMYGQRLTDARAWLSTREHRPTACFAASSGDALGIQAGALQSGLALPRDLSLITVDDFFVNQGFPITTVFTNMTRLGRQAGEMMLTKLDHPKRSLKPVVQQYKIVEGLTTGPPAV